MNFSCLILGGAIENLPPCERRYEWGGGGGHQEKI